MPVTATMTSEYQKLTLHEQIVKRPETYVGSISQENTPMYVWEDKMVYREMMYTPGLYKLFDELLVNALDNKQRCDNMRVLNICITDRFFTIENDGDTIPVEKHEKHDCWLPEMCFGQLLTSNNYDDTEKRTTGGRNGYGAKLSNIFSKRFQVNVQHGGKTFEGVWTNNMFEFQGAVIKKTKAKRSWTKIYCEPDVERFGCTSIHPDMVALMQRRAYDAAGTTPKNVKVTLNGQEIPNKHFASYAALYGKGLYFKLNERWECVIMSANQRPSLSFVNGICTPKGGTHVKALTQPVLRYIAKTMTKRLGSVTISPTIVAEHVCFLINCIVENPTFDSQCKETLTLKADAFGSEPVWDDNMLKKTLKCGVEESLTEWVRAKSMMRLQQKTRVAGRRLYIPKLHDANKAGGIESKKCCLLLTEGDSALSMAISGLSVVGRDYFGAFPLKGKLLNVRDASNKKILENKEIQHILRILGLQVGSKDYSKMRYGSVMAMTDQDTDGSHIKGLLLNMFDVFFPDLLKTNDFFCVFQTPIVRAMKGGKKRYFYSLPEYESCDAVKGWTIKYYKGLGTSTNQEAKEYFKAIDKHKIVFDASNNSNALILAFDKLKAPERKQWLANVPGDAGLVQVKNVDEFVHKELILHSLADNVRSIANLMDGLKPSQRKILFACLKRNLTNEIKVNQLAGYVSEHTDYHHGEASLVQAIIHMAQHFRGANNLPLLQDNGQFGTRLLGGKDHASGRYIFTKLSPITRDIFHIDDDPILPTTEHEPLFYAPVVPMVLVNGCKGIGTGWACCIPRYDVHTVVSCVRRWLNQQVLEEPLPSNASSMDGTKWYFEGTLEVVSDYAYRITELPEGVWTSTYKEWLENQVFVSRVEDRSTESAVDMTVKTNKKLNTPKQTLKLIKSVSKQSMVLFDVNNRLKKYESVLQIMDEYCKQRLMMYDARLIHVIDELECEIKCAREKAQVIEWIVQGVVKSLTLEEDLVARGMDPERYLSLTYRQTTSKAVERLHQKIKDLEDRLRYIKGLSAKQAWLNDLESLFKNNKRLII